MEPLIAVGFAFYLFTKGFFAKGPDEPSEEKKLGEALIKYLEKGVKIKT
ncbi:MAG: hypothetical protein WBG38_06455 [Nodosilinea sp.]